MNQQTWFYRRTITILTIALILLLGIIFLSLTNAQPAARIYLENSTVLVNSKPAHDGQPLKQADIIETKTSPATVILHDSIIITLQPNTRITLKDLSRQHTVIKQTGTTWNKFIHLTGINKFSIHTSNSIASVRGTSFELSEDHIIVGDGEVTYTRDNTTIIVPALTVVEKINQKLSKRTAKPDEITRITKHTQQTITIIKHHIKKSEKHINKLKENIKHFEKTERLLKTLEGKKTPKKVQSELPSEGHHNIETRKEHFSTTRHQPKLPSHRVSEQKTITRAFTTPLTHSSSREGETDETHGKNSK